MSFLNLFSTKTTIDKMKILKRILCLILLITVSHSIIAQDVLTLKDGREVKSKVTEVTDKYIKYKKADNIDGPTYTVEKTEIAKIKYANGSEEIVESPAATTNTDNSSEPDIFTMKFDTENERIHDYLEAIAKNVGSIILERCTGRVDNYSTEIYWDQTFRDEITKEINLAIIVKWEKGFEARKRWVKGIIKLDKSGRKIWSYQGDGGITFSNCAKTITNL